MGLGEVSGVRGLGLRLSPGLLLSRATIPPKLQKQPDHGESDWKGDKRDERKSVVGMYQLDCAENGARSLQNRNYRNREP